MWWKGLKRVISWELFQLEDDISNLLSDIVKFLVQHPAYKYGIPNQTILQYNDTETELARKRSEMKSVGAETVMTGTELKKYIADIRQKSTVYKARRAEVRFLLIISIFVPILAPVISFLSQFYY